MEMDDDAKLKVAHVTANKRLKAMFSQKVPANKLLTKNPGQFFKDHDTVSPAVLRVGLWWQSAYCNCATLQVQEELKTYMSEQIWLPVDRQGAGLQNHQKIRQ